MGISKSSYSYWLNKGKYNYDEKIKFYQKVINIYSEYNGIYGAKKICEVMSEEGIEISISTVSRAMKTLGIRSIVAEKFPHKRSSLKDKDKIVNLIKNLTVNRINQVWTTDITYIKTKHEGYFYLITYIDYYSKRVVSWDLRRTQRAEDMIEVLNKAIQKRSPTAGLIIHSDKGSQMRSTEYREFLSRHQMIASYTSLNHSCDENAAQESFHALLKKECIYQNKPKDFDDAYTMIHRYIENFYNTVRIHSSIGYLSPVDFEKIS